MDWPVPDFSTLSHRQKSLAVHIPCRGFRGRLYLLLDSTGIEGDGEWHAHKHGVPKRCVRRRIHLGIDEETLEVRAVGITGRHIGDAPVLPGLLGQIPADQQIASVTAEGACGTRKSHDAIAERGAHAVIPPRKTAKPWKTVIAGAVARNEARRRRNTLAAPFGDDGADTTAEVASRRRCTV